ncbi:hypothetical protein DFH09DRAFT_1362524 [Mycena vulgaris]|nr:hypothetical protein DFH09DRAFT_1362524 [Mycena vulgaris]
MFSKLLAFGLCALTFAAAAPSQQVSISCVIGQSAPATQLSTSTGPIPPGRYRIINQAGRGLLKSSDEGAPIIFSKVPERPGPYEEWIVEAAGEQTYHIVSNLVHKPVAYLPEGPLIVSRGEPWMKTEFSLSPAGNEEFVVKVPDQDMVWTIADMIVPSSPIILKGQDGSAAQRWYFQRLA